jgi:hypothetical protein
MFKTTQKNLKFFLGLCLFLGSIGLFLTNCNIGGGSSDQTTGVDKIAPVVISTLPADQETGVALNTEVSASFSEVMDANTINANSFSLTLQQNGNVVPGSVSYNGSKAVLKPLTNLNYNTEYTAIITTMAKDLAGNPLFTNHSWSFKTLSDTAAPQINSFYPVENAQGVAINASISVTFDEAMDSASITDTVFLLFHGTQVVSGQEVSGTIIYSGNTAVFKPSVLLNISTIYTAIISTGAKDLAGNALSQGRTWSFTTSSSSDITPPSITTTAPSNNAIGVALSSVITATFNENMNGTTINVSSFTVNDGTGNIVFLARNNFLKSLTCDLRFSFS